MREIQLGVSLLSVPMEKVCDSNQRLPKTLRFRLAFADDVGRN